MKKRILTIATMLFLAIMIPLTVNAATISAEPTEMKVGDIVTVTVEVKTADTKSVQFDLDFDNTKYKYVLGSAESELDSTISNLLDDDTVRVSAFNFNTNATVQKVTLKFEAISAGTSVPFEVVDGTLEATDETGTTTMEPFADATAVVKKIEGIPAKDDKEPEYFDENGNPITKHKPTGDLTRATTRKSIAGVYTKLIQGKLVVPYALPTSDDILTIEDIKAEFGDNVDVTGLTNPVKSGDIFTLNGLQHTVLIYGDVNKDGKVTTADALIIRQYELSKLTPDEITTVTSEVADSLEDSKAVQQFVVRLRQTSTKTILDKYPVEFSTNDIAFTVNASSILRGEKTLVATISAKDGRAITSELLGKINIPNVTIEPKDENGTIEIYATSNINSPFDVIATLTGNNIENGKITSTPQNVTIKEVGTVNDIKLFDEEGNEIKGNLNLLSGNSKKIIIKYYHIYPDGTPVELTDENISKDFFNINRVKFNKPTQINSILHNQTGIYDNVDNMSSSGLTSRYALYIGSILDKTGTETLTLTVENNDSQYLNTQNYQANCVKTFDVVVYNETVTQLKIDGQIKNDGDSIDLNLYKVPQTNNDKVVVYNNSLDSTKPNPLPYTLVDISLITNGTVGTKSLTTSICGVGTNEKPSLINNADGLIIVENDEPEDSLDLDVVYFKKINDQYVKIDTPSTGVDYIGIACYFDNSYPWEDSISILEKGLTIYFGEKSDGTIPKKQIHVNVTGIETDLGATTNAPTNPNVPSDSNGLKDPFADTGIDLNEPNSLLKSKSALDATLKTTTADTTPSPDSETTPDKTSSTDPEVTPDATPSADPETTPDTTPSADPEVTPDATPSAKPETTPESDTTI